ncbi:membrane protein [Ruminococcus gauvreauii]|uniref:Rhomboid family intramembrane serine protease n=1 Tax=Ruminococcus gauvreauii TaxID=438033 RepID=A0ABY5VGW3_9FIRM|nr:membrane protein [Ruminococcus gauvreauii]UWP59834.1 hypothetical protein NQ502_01875 [Ruminococcus gauvreauii]
MNWINKMERKFGKYAIPNLTLYIIITYVVGYLLMYLAPNVMDYCLLEPGLILRGQVWRLVSWLLIPPGSLDIFTIIMLFFYYSIGTTLEKTWGAFRYNFYIFGGIILTVIGSFIMYFVLGGGTLLIMRGGFFSTYYISLSIFLGFAATYPDMQVLLYFIIPIKIKWLAWLDVIFLAWQMIQSGWTTRVAIICSLMNFIIYFFATRNLARYSPHEVKRKRTYAKAVHKSQSPNVTKHKCAVCGRTEKDGDDLEFRFCSKCRGNYEYCQDHLFTHKHIQ